MTPLAIKNLQMIGAELAIVWTDGHESYFPLEKLRRSCPCAQCAGEPDGLVGIVKPTVTYRAGSFLLRECGAVGSYAIQPVWQDGHQTGLYSFAYLRGLETSAFMA